MSTSTSHQPDDAGLGAVDRVLVQDIDAAEGGLLVQPLSDLSRAAAAYLKERWPGLPSATRLAFVQAMRQDAEEQIEHNYNRALLVALRDADAETRLSAIDGLAELDSHVFCVILLEHVEDEPDERVRAVEAMALGRFALQSELDLLDDETATRLKDTLLRLCVGDPSAEVRRRALESLGYLAGDSDVVRQISEAYESGIHALRVSALHAMGRLADPRWLDIVHDELTSDEPELRFEAVTAAGTIGDERSVIELIDRITDEDVEVQMAAIASLGTIGGQLAINTLRTLTEDDSEAIVDAAEDALEEARLISNPLRPLM
ncbi:MAG: HEAT repeat domain-containing protein [Thermomicrobiales bacterium]